jgi:hypothetical protein
LRFEVRLASDRERDLDWRLRRGAA